MPAPAAPAVAWFGSPIPDRINMLQPCHFLQGTGIIHDSVSKADNINQWTIYNTLFAGGANVNTVSLGAMALAPDGTNTGQKIVEATNNGLHQMQAFAFMNGGLLNGIASLQVRLAVIAKAAERTRIALQVVSPNNDCGVTTVFDLAGGQIGVAGTVFGTIGHQDPNGIGARYRSIADAITALGSGWYLCVMDVGLGDPNTPRFGATLSLDNGSGTAAISTSYAGDGSSGVVTWHSNALPKHAYALTQQSFFDDFASINTIDVNDTRAPGFNWYVHNTFPFLFSFLPTAPSAYSVSSSILTCAGSPNISGSPNVFVLNTCAVPTAGVTYVGTTPDYIGHAFVPPFLAEANLHWDDDVSTTRTFQSSFWTFNINALFGPNPPATISGPHLEIDVYEDFVGPSQRDVPITTWFNLTSEVTGGNEVESQHNTTPQDAYPVWKSVILYTPPVKVSYSGAFYNALLQSGPSGANPPTTPGTNPAIWQAISPTPVLAVDFGQFHTYSQLKLPYVSQLDPGVMMAFFDGIAVCACCYGPDVLGPISPEAGGAQTLGIADNQGFPFFISTGVNYGVFYDWVSFYQTPQSALASLSIHDSSATTRQTQALDPSTVGTGPWDGGRILIDGVAGVNQGILTPYGPAIDSSAVTQPVQEATCSSSTQTNVASSASSVPLFGPNPARLGITLFNDSTQILYLFIGSGDDGNAFASTSRYTIQVAAGARYEFPVWWVGGAYGIWASANGFARITELTA